MPREIKNGGYDKSPFSHGFLLDKSHCPQTLCLKIKEVPGRTFPTGPRVKNLNVNPAGNFSSCKGRGQEN